MFPSSPEFASYLGFPYYSDLTSCVNGHANVRNTKAGYCVGCSTEYRKRNPHVFNAAGNRYRSKKLKACPLWANQDAITEIYRQAAEISLQTGIPHDVDHEIPLQGKLVCGLHVENNLQIIPASENRQKSNKFAIH